MVTVQDSNRLRRQWVPREAAPVGGPTIRGNRSGLSIVAIAVLSTGASTTVSPQPSRFDRFKAIALAVKDRVKRHHSPIFAAAVAFFAFLAMIPAMTGFITGYGIVADPDDITQQLGDALENAPETTREFLISQMSDIADNAGGALGVGLAVSILLALFSASGAVANLMKALNVAYDLDETRKPWILRGTALALMIGGVVLLGVVLFLMAALPAVLDAVGFGEPVQLLFNILRFPVLAIVMMIGLSILYRMGPDHRGNDKPRAPKLITIGGVVGTVLFVVLSALFSFYTSNLGSYGETYGPLATIIVLLLWLQLSALAIILGAEVDAEVRDRQWRAQVGAPLDDEIVAPPQSAAGIPVAVAAAERLFAAHQDRDVDEALAQWGRGGVENHMMMGELAAPEQVRSNLASLFAAFPDLQVDVHDIHGDDDVAVVRYGLKGTFDGEPWGRIKPNGRELDVEAVAVVRQEDGWIVRTDTHLDPRKVTAQIGARPGDDAGSLVTAGVSNLKTWFGEKRAERGAGAEEAVAEAAAPVDASAK